MNVLSVQCILLMFSPLHVLLFCYCEADDIEVARELLQWYDTQMASPDSAARVHRVMHYLLGQGPEQLGSDFREYCRAGTMSVRLRTEITAYQLCTLDESMVESPHALVSRITSSGRASQPVYWFSSLRFNQNLSFRHEWNVLMPRSFPRFFRQWKCMGQRSEARWQRRIPVKQRTRAFLNFVYRLRNECRQDVAAVPGRAEPSDVSPPAPGDEDDRAALKKDFVSCLFQAGSFFSVPGQADVDRVEELAPSVTSASAPPKQPLVFQVISADFVDKKHVETDQMRLFRRFANPAFVQYYECWNLQKYPCDHLDVYPSGPVEVIDLLKVASWDDLSLRTVCWGAAIESDIAGCTQLTHPTGVASRDWCSYVKSNHPTHYIFFIGFHSCLTPLA